MTLEPDQRGSPRHLGRPHGLGAAEIHDTPRLRLRQWRESDRDPFAALNADPEVMAWFPALLDRAASDARLDAARTAIDERGWGLWAAELRATGEFIGFIGLAVPRHAMPCGPCVEIGWRLARRFWRIGLATEGGRCALEVGFQRLELPEVVSFTAVGNRRSRAVMQRLGLRDTGLDFDHPGVPIGNPLRRHCLYRIARADWPRRP